MIECRPFNNSDPPRLAAFWQQHPQPGLARPMTGSVFEHVVLGKLQFRSESLLLASHHDRLLGFIHLAQGTEQDNHETGGPIVNMLLVDSDWDDAADVADLLVQTAVHNVGDAIQTARPYRQHPFYTGLYGGTGFPGFLESDPEVIGALARNGFQTSHRRGIYRAPVATVSAPLAWEVRQFRRHAHVSIHSLVVDPEWRDTDSRSHLQRTLIQLDGDSDRGLLGQIEIWDQSPLLNGWSGPAIGIHRPCVDECDQPEIVTSALLCEAIAVIQRAPAEFIEVYDDLADPDQLLDLGFELVDQAVEMERH